MRRPPRFSSNSAFTLVESLIASVIVFISSMATLALLAWLRTHNDVEQERSRAHQIISQEMERVRLELFTRITPGETLTVWDNGTTDDTSDDTFGTLEVVMFDPETGGFYSSPPNPAKRVGVEVSLTWSPRGRLRNRDQRETLMSYLSP